MPTRSDFCVRDAAKRRLEIDRVKEWTERAAKIGATTVRIFAGTLEKGDTLDRCQKQVTDALARQKDLVQTGAAHKLIGMIMLEMGALGTTELIEVLREMNTPAAPRTERRTLP